MFFVIIFFNIGQVNCGFWRSNVMKATNKKTFQKRIDLLIARHLPKPGESIHGEVWQTWDTAELPVVLSLLGYDCSLVLQKSRTTIIICEFCIKYHKVLNQRLFIWINVHVVAIKIISFAFSVTVHFTCLFIYGVILSINST